MTPPFTEIFARFRTSLQESDIFIVAGYSFRDLAVNRMVLEALKAKRRHIVVIDPQIHEMVERHPVVHALQNYGVLIACPKKISDISPAEITEWLEMSLALAPDSITVPPGSPIYSASDWTHVLIVNLSLLEYYFLRFADFILRLRKWDKLGRGQTLLSVSPSRASEWTICHGCLHS